jgi:hypothetical protein
MLTVGVMVHLAQDIRPIWSDSAGGFRPNSPNLFGIRMFWKSAYFGKLAFWTKFGELQGACRKGNGTSCQAGACGPDRRE